MLNTNINILSVFQAVVPWVGGSICAKHVYSSSNICRRLWMLGVKD